MFSSSQIDTISNYIRNGVYSGAFPKFHLNLFPENEVVLLGNRDREKIISDILIGKFSGDLIMEKNENRGSWSLTKLKQHDTSK
jgi:hypothetical protein